MSKIMVVEDDASLREIYSIRITAEGYEVVSAGDGEEALAVAVREKPDLILSDVMMPKISGFDMLDILRSTPETSSIKVIMMTALSADDQRQRGERLGANRYLVKSQVGIEDVINAIHEVLGDRETSDAMPASTDTTAPNANPAAQAPVEAPVPVEAPAATTASAEPVASASQAPVSEPVAPAPAETQIPEETSMTTETPAPTAMPETPNVIEQVPASLPESQTADEQPAA